MVTLDLPAGRHWLRAKVGGDREGRRRAQEPRGSGTDGRAGILLEEQDGDRSPGERRRRSPPGWGLRPGPW